MRSRGFTLIEILIVVGIVGILASIIIIAVNPRQNLRVARDSRRTHEAREIEQGMFQYLIEEEELPTNDALPEGDESDALPICIRGVDDGTCLNFDPLLVPDYLGYIPRDDQEPCALYTGYKAYQENDRPHVFANFMGIMPGDTPTPEPCGPPPPPTLVPLDVRDGKSGCGKQDDWYIGGTPEGYNSDYWIKTASGIPSEYAKCRVHGVSSGNSYEFFVTWVAFSTNAADATYKIYTGNESTLLGTVVKDTSIAPDDAQYGGSMWESLGTYTVSDNSATIRLDNAGSGTLVFDAAAVTAP